MVMNHPRLSPLTDCATSYRRVLSSERALQEEEQLSGKRKEKEKSGHGPQRGARHQDILTDRLSVVK
jgi:hypothetical protein